MKRELTLSACLAFFSAFASFAAPFTPGDVAVERVGDGTAALGSGSTPLFIDEYTPEGSLVQSIAIPSNGVTAVVSSGSATSEGQLTLSADGRQLVIAGYNTNAGVTKIASTTAAQAVRVAATIDYDGNFALGPNAGTNFSGNNIRSATSDGKGSFWAAGANSGTLYLTNGQAPVVVEVTQPTSGNTRVNEIFGGNLYYSSGSAEGVFLLGALPTATTTPIKVVTDTGSPYDFAVSPDTNIIYVADDNSFGAGGVLKYTNGPSGYALAYTLTNGLGGPGTRSLAVDFSGSAPVLYAVTTNNTLVKAVDAGSNSVFTAIVTAAANTAIRSVKFAPTPPAFVPGNLAVVRYGGGGQALGAVGNTINIDQYTTTGALVSTVAIPDSGPASLIGQGNSFVEGFLSRSADGSMLAFAGYNTERTNTTSIVSASATAIPRAIGTIDYRGVYTLQITNSAFSATSIRGAATDGAGNFWESGGNTGVIYAGVNEASNVVSSAPLTNLRGLDIFNGTLYYSSGSGSARGVYGLGGTPFSGPVTATNMATSGGSSSPFDFAISPDGTIVYLSDTSATNVAVSGITKYVFNGTAWASNYTFLPNGTNAFGFTVDFSGANPIIYAVTGLTNNNSLVSIIDNGPSSASNPGTVLATAPVGEEFKGVRFAPGSLPSFTASPTDVTISAGNNATFSASATGVPAPTIQWYSNGVAIPWVLTSSITFTNAGQILDGTTVYAVAANMFGSATSRTATLHVTGTVFPVVVSISPSNLVVNAGQPATFTVSAINASNYFWFHGATPLSDTGEFTNTATATLTINPAFAADDGNYSVIVSNQYGTATSGVVTLSVNDPYIATEPMGFTNFPGFGTNFNVLAVGSQPLTYQWLSNGVAIAGATSTNFFVTSSSASETTYSVVVSNGLGLAVTSVVAIADFNPYLIWDDFNYTNGNIVTTSDGLWQRHSGAANDSYDTNLLMTNIFDIYASNGVYVVDQYREDDINRAFSIPQPEDEGITVYASFTIDMQTLPANAGGTYLAHFCDTNVSSGYWGRLFALTTNAQAPGAYRLGVANTQGDYNANSAVPSGPYEIVNTADQPPQIVADAIYPLDLATNIPYQVVMAFDIDNRVTKLWINPTSESDSNVVALDQPTTVDGFPLSYFDFRQSGGEGVSYMDDLRVATNFADVTTNEAALPIIGEQPQGITGYSGNDFFLEVCASGKGLAYQWYKDGAEILDATTNTFELPNRNGSDSGSYTCVLTTAAGSVTSAVANVTIDDLIVEPFFTTQPQNATNYVGSGATFTAAATGTGPLTYAWYFYDGANTYSLGNNGITVITYPNTPTLTLKHLNESEAGTYYATATGPGGTGTSSNALLVINSPPITPIAVLRDSVNPSTTDTTTTTGSALFAIQGTITLQTNITTGNTASYYIQDSTGGIDLFITGDSTFRPPLGAEVTAIGTLDVYQNELELEADATQPNEPYFVNVYTNGSNIINNLPAPQVLPLDYLANSANQLSLITNVDGSLVMLTNVYFVNGGQLFSSNGSHDYVVSNAQGTAELFADSAVATNFTGLTIPNFAYSVTAPLAKYNGGWELQLASPSQIVTNPPPSFSAAATLNAGSTTLAWPAVPYNYAYTVLSAPTVPNAFAPAGGNAISSAVVFTNSAGNFHATNSGASQFYQIISP